MPDIRLTFTMAPYDRVIPLINGEVKPRGITLDYVEWTGGSTTFYEQIKFQRYDVSEMSLSSFLRMRSIGWPYRMLPVFHNRNFAWATTKIHKNSGIRQGHPEDLKGKRIGIRDYQQSLGLWVRGILQMEWDVNPEDLIWYQERSEHYSHTGASNAAGLTLPEGVKIIFAKSDLNTMLRNGEIDASISYSYGDGLGPHDAQGLNRTADSIESSDINTLFVDPRQEAIRFFKKHGIFPPHHTTVIRENIIEEHPWIAISLMEAFEESKRIAIERFRSSLPRSLMVFGQYYVRENDEIFGNDPYPYGIKSNAEAINIAQTISVQQGLTKSKQAAEEIFPHEVIYREERL